MGASTLPSDYQFLDSLSLPLTIASFVIVVVGSYLRRDGYPSHRTVGMAAEAVGWVAMIAGQVVLAQIASQNSVDCSVWHRCDVLDEGPLAYAWNTMLRPAMVDAVILVVAEAVGWAIAKITPRHNSSRKQ